MLLRFVRIFQLCLLLCGCLRLRCLRFVALRSLRCDLGLVWDSCAVGRLLLPLLRLYLGCRLRFRLWRDLPLRALVTVLAISVLVLAVVL